MYDLLQDTVFSVVDMDGKSTRLSLPGLFEALGKDSVRSMAGIRPHQRHAFHAFMCQLGAIAGHAHGAIPADATAWASALSGLVADENAWHLISPVDKPAVFQPVTDMGSMKAERSTTPDEIDVVMTAKTHEIKPARMIEASPEHWFFALMTLQTTEGFLGAGNFGISRMNGGFSNRSGLTLKPAGGLGAHIMRDIDVLLENRKAIVAKYRFPAKGAALLWTLPWDGKDTVGMDKLDPYYIEICRRVRLVEADGKISAITGNSSVKRTASLPGGETGDPWTPVIEDKDGRKALSVDGRGFSYTALSKILFSPGDIEPALCSVIRNKDGIEGLSIVARALVRGQGKTEGYHERIVPVTPNAVGMLTRKRDELARIANERIQDVSAASYKMLKTALVSLFQNGPDKPNFDDKAASKKAESIVETLKDRVDARFFDDLWREAEGLAISHDAANAIRKEWQKWLVDEGRTILNSSVSRRAGSRRLDYKAISVANGMYEGGARKNFPAVFEKEKQEDMVQ